MPRGQPWSAPPAACGILRITEVVKLDLQIKDGKVEAFRAKVSVSFKYEDKE